MKKIFSAVLSLSALCLTSCDDFLDIIPLNDIVAENYWTEKADVQSILYGCYSQMESADVLQRLFVWGEVRSDNITNTGSTDYALRQIIDENILETNNWTNWQPLYQVINRCNTVILNAPMVAAIDPNYDSSEVQANVAEATFLRTLAYFYLLRTFRDVPYRTEPSLNDNDIENDYRIAPMPYAQLLDQLIMDMEAVKDHALRLYPKTANTGDAANTSRVTTCAIYALLADLYLWKNDYQHCIDYCNRVLAYKMERYEEMKEEDPESANELELWYDKYPLYQEQPAGNNQGNVYNHIFGQGNSFESIFELYFQTNQPTTNTLVSSFFGNTSTPVGQCAAYSGLSNGIYDKNNNVFRPSDCRVPEFFEEQSGGQCCIRKYAYQSTSFTISKSGNITQPARPGQMRSNSYANWIIYRLTDVMLMKAEAEVEIGTPNAMDDAFQLVSTIYNRANNFNTASADTLVRADYANKMRELVLEERRRELLFEGKRWYDLVRLSLRQNDNTYLVNSVTQKQKERAQAISLQLQDPNALFWPYLESELDANPKLRQNEAYIKSETSQK